jgi:hypothetical protein
MPSPAFDDIDCRYRIYSDNPAVAADVFMNILLYFLNHKTGN